MASQLSDSRSPLTGRSASVPGPPHLRVQGLAKSFGARNVLRGLDLDIGRGEFVAIVGRSGCGKSTLLRLIAGLETPERGGVEVDGGRLLGRNLAARMMFQDARLLPWERVLENVGLGQGRDWRERAEAALADVGLADRARDWPGVLSGGQRQRVALARALAGDPEMLLLDEPLGALDALTRREMQSLIECLWQRHGCTVLLITHDVEEAVALADRVLALEQGQIRLDVPVTLPRPRDRAGTAFLGLREEILARITAE